MKLLLGQLLLSLNPEEDLLGGLEFGTVQSFLFAFDFAEQVFFDAIREILGDLSFCATQQERPDARGEAASCQGVAFGIIKAAELGAAAENAGHGERHETPQIEQLILDWCSGKHQSVAAFQTACDLSRLRAWVFDVLAFVEHHRQPVHLGKAFAQKTIDNAG